MPSVRLTGFSSSQRPVNYYGPRRSNHFQVCEWSQIKRLYLESPNSRDVRFARPRKEMLRSLLLRPFRSNYQENSCNKSCDPELRLQSLETVKKETKNAGKNVSRVDRHVNRERDTSRTHGNCDVKYI